MPGASATGAEVLLQTLHACGLDTFFANPGTSEMHLVAAIDRTSGIRAVLGLFEGVVTGAADGYARISGKPAATLLHLGPRFANGIANLHNAKRARSAVVNIIGDHATWHLALDAPLTANPNGLTAAISHWSRRLGGPELPLLTATAACQPDCSRQLRLGSRLWAPVQVCAHPRPALRCRSAHPATRLSGAAHLGIRARRAHRRPYRDAVPSTRVTNTAVVVERIPYFAEQALDFLAAHDCIVLAGSRAPVGVFAYPQPPPPALTALATLEEDVQAALADLSDELDAPAAGAGISRQQSRETPLPQGPLTATAVANAIAALMPENSIVSDEGCQLLSPPPAPRHTIGSY